MFKWVILLSVLWASAVAANTVWMWTDEDGQVHYSDRPVPGARQIELRGAQTVEMPDSAAAARGASGPGASDTQAQPYRFVEVLSPAAEEMFWNIAGVLNVQVAMAPALRADHRLDVAINGERRNVNAQSTRLTVPEVWRGEHVLQAVIVDAQGRELQRSEPVTFYVQQTSILNPNNPNVRR